MEQSRRAPGRPRELPLETIEIAESCSEVNGRVASADTTTRASLRTLRVSPLVLSILSAHVVARSRPGADDIGALKQRLGHSSIRVTSDVYNSLLPAVDESVATAFEESFGEPRGLFADSASASGDAYQASSR